VVVFVPPRRLAALIAASSLALAACSGGSSSSKVSAPPGSKMTKMGVAVTGGFGEKPALTVPTSAAPKDLSSEVLTAGSGATVASGQTLIVNYLGQTWDLKNGKPNVFDNSYDRKQVSGFPIGTGKVIPGWDKTLVGQKLGSRVLLSIPPADAYGATPSSGNELAGKTLLFVVDLVAALSPNAAATGTAVTKLPAGLPAITSESGKKPVITSVKGIKVGNQPVSALLIEGTGEAISPTKSLALEIVQTDAATGKQTQETWGSGLQVIPAQQVISVLDVLKTAKVGSRAVGVLPAEAASSSSGSQTPASIVVVDVVGQY
jgi:peptidylprolyl isomerase